MTNPIDSLQRSEGTAIYYDADFRITLDNHLNYLRTHPTTVVMDITPTQAYTHEGDFYALLTALNVPRHLFWLILRMNNLTNPAELTKELTFIIHPSSDQLNLIRQRHLISYGKNN